MLPGLGDVLRRIGRLASGVAEVDLDLADVLRRPDISSARIIRTFAGFDATGRFLAVAAAGRSQESPLWPYEGIFSLMYLVAP